MRALVFTVGAAVFAAGCAVPKWPVSGPISSPYGVRLSGALPSVHRGVDIAVPVGTAIRPMTAGRVRFAGEMSGYGRVVWIDHGGHVTTIYAHLSEIFVDAGQVIADDEVLGLSGQSGHATGPHLHFEIRRWDRSEDPVPLLGGFPGR